MNQERNWSSMRSSCAMNPRSPRMKIPKTRIRPCASLPPKSLLQHRAPMSLFLLPKPLPPSKRAPLPRRGAHYYRSLLPRELSCLSESASSESHVSIARKPNRSPLPLRPICSVHRRGFLNEASPSLHSTANISPPRFHQCRSCPCCSVHSNEERGGSNSQDRQWHFQLCHERNL